MIMWFFNKQQRYVVYGETNENRCLKVCGNKWYNWKYECNQNAVARASSENIKLVVFPECSINFFGCGNMTEKEKMLSCKMYDANNDKELLKERTDCKDLCHKFNSLLPSETNRQMELLKKILGKTKNDFCIMSPFWCDYGYNIEIGENFFANHNLVILDGAKVKFGDNVFVAPDCGFYTAGHPIDYERRNAGLEYAYPITVGDNVWIGGGVKVMPGVTIGSNVVIGGGSVVTKDIPDNVVAVGNPCRVLRAITDDDKKTDFNLY